MAAAALLLAINVNLSSIKTKIGLCPFTDESTKEILTATPPDMLHRTDLKDSGTK